MTSEIYVMSMAMTENDVNMTEKDVKNYQNSLDSFLGLGKLSWCVRCHHIGSLTVC